MKDSTKTQTNATVKATKQPNIQKHQPKEKVTTITTVTAVVAIMADLRSEAAAHYQQFEVQGRKAATRLVHAVYVQYHAAAGAGQLDKVVAELKTLLSQEERPAPAKSTNCGVLIRYIFKDFTPKQVYQYGRSLEIAFSKNVEPEDFIAFVENAKGFEKLCADNPVSGNVSMGTKSVQIALTLLQNSQADHILADEDWGESEIARVYIAVPSGDGAIQLVNAQFSENAVKATLDRYRVENDQAKKEKAKKAEEAKAIEKIKSTIAVLEDRKSKAEVKVLKAEQELSSANNGSDVMAKALAKIKLDDAEEQLEELEEEIKTLKQQLAA